MSDGAQLMPTSAFAAMPGRLGRALARVTARAGQVFPAAGFWVPPLHRREFWITQALVAAVVVLHEAAEATGALGTIGPAYVFSVALLIVPVLYSAAVFGVQGSLPTAIWSAVVMLPNLLIESASASRLGEIWQLGVVLLLAGFVGSRVDREVRARSRAERREKELAASEQRYRTLFGSAPFPIFISDDVGVVLEVNDAATVLVDEPADRARGQALAAVVGDEIAGMILGQEEPRVVRVESRQLGARWLLPAGTSFEETDGSRRIQVVLRDVTTLEDRTRGIEAFARRTLAAREEERRRIARELHDGPLQSVIMLSRRLSSHDQPTSPEGRRDLREVQALAHSIAAELRQASRNLRPSILDDLGLGAALRAEGDLVARQLAIGVQFRLVGSPRGLSAATELMLLRVTQEALRNVVRHAGASNVLIELSYRPASVKLSIADDGRGPGPLLPAGELVAAGKLGIVGMIERTGLLGASCRIRAKRHGGTIVEVMVPSDAEGGGSERRLATGAPLQRKGRGRADGAGKEAVAGLTGREGTIA